MILMIIKIVFKTHRDSGYNGIVYFSDECGTNLYSPDFYDKSARELGNEHKTVY